VTITLPTNTVIVMSPRAVKAVMKLSGRNANSSPAVVLDVERAMFWGIFEIPTKERKSP